MTDLFLVIVLAGRIGLMPIDIDLAACEQIARLEQARLGVLVDPAITVRCEHRGPEHMMWRLHPELRR